jgi:SAM-dependent methyltransferase
VRFFVARLWRLADNGATMNLAHRPPASDAFAQPLTEELLARAGIGPGMRVLVPAAGSGGVAFLVAERVGASGTVLGIDADERAVAHARCHAREQRFDGVSFEVGSLCGASRFGSFDAVVARFFLMREPDPVAALRHAADALHDGGRLVVHEWHFASTLWAETSQWPDLPLYRRFGQSCLGALRHLGVHVDMGLRLANAFAEAGLPLPAIRTDLRTVHAGCAPGFAFFEETLRELLPAIEASGIAAARDLDVDTFAQRLAAEALARGGHAFLPLQVGAWTRV